MSESTDPGTVDALLDRADAGWAWFRAAAVALAPDAWEEEVPGGGWTRHKMLNHVRVWHELTAQRLASYLESGEVPPPPGDEDAVNAQAAADADLRTREMILAQLDSSYARLREAIARLTQPQLVAHEAWPARVVAANTWGHYEDHRRDVEADDQA